MATAFPSSPSARPSDDDGGNFRGAVFIVSLNSAGGSTFVQKISDTSGGLSSSLDNGDLFGASVSGIANFDGLGGGGLIVGATGDDDGGAGKGAVICSSSRDRYSLAVTASSTPAKNATTATPQTLMAARRLVKRKTKSRSSASRKLLDSCPWKSTG